MLILAVDSTAKSASVAIMKDERLLGEFFLHTGFTHSETLLPMIENLLLQCRLSVSDIDYCAISQGPGSFTGVRIGVSALKGIAMPHDIPSVGVSTLEAMAHQSTMLNGIICASMDARRNEVYNALFRAQSGKITRLCDDRAISVTELSKELLEYKETVFFVGDGAELCYNNCNVENSVLLDEHLRYQRAVGVAKVAVKKIGLGEILSATELMPTYLRLSQAERERIEMENKNNGL